jgi:WS/DGAT/MGAT family acyltransferase
MAHDRLSALDASFLYLDGPSTPMHISSLAIYEGPMPAPEELTKHLARRLPLVPRFRQRLETVPFNAHRPVWVSDPSFDLEAHLNHVALPWPGTETQLSDLVARILSHPLSRTRPLWEMWLIDGLSGDRFAILSKTHHSLWDGVSGVDLHSVLLDIEPQPHTQPELRLAPAVPLPTRAQLFTNGVRERFGEAIGFARSSLRAVRDPRAVVRSAAELAAGTASLAGSLVRPAPDSALNGDIGSARRFSLGRASLEDLKRLKDAYGTTVNDAVLAAVAGALRIWHLHRGVVPRDLKVMVPVSVRAENDWGTLGNRVVMLVVALPVSQDDPVLRLKTVHNTMQTAKRSAQVSAGDALVKASAFLPPQAVAGVSWAQAHYRAFNLLVTNVPGPQFPLYLRGRRLLELFGQAPLAANQGLSIAALSYDNKIGFGLLADHTLVPDVECLAEGIEASTNELRTLVPQRRPKPADERVLAFTGPVRS